MRTITNKETIEVAGGDLRIAAVIAGAAIGGLIGATYGYEIAESASIDSNAWAQYHNIDAGISIGASLGAMGGAFITALPLFGFEAAFGCGILAACAPHLFNERNYRPL